MKINVLPAGSKGRGVFASQRIPSHLYLETAPANIITREQRRDLKALGDLGEYPFVNRAEWKELPAHQKHLCSGFVVWGVMSIVNHAVNPEDANVRVDLIKKMDGYYGVMVATKTIESGQELLLSYPDAEEYDGYDDWSGPAERCEIPAVQASESAGVTRVEFRPSKLT